MRFIGFLSSFLLVLASAAALRAQPPAGADFYHDFRGGKRPQAPLDLYGRGADVHSKPEAEGWRITVPANQPKQTTIGLIVKAPVKGDFELTTSYEILEAERPQGRIAAGFEFFIMTDTPTKEAIGFARWARNQEGEVYTCSRMTTGADGQRQYKHQHIPAHASSGRLRLVRSGAEVTFWADEGTGDFRKLWGYALGVEDLALVRLTAYTPPEHSAVDIRIVDMKIRASAVPGMAVPVGATTPSSTRMLRFLLLGLGGVAFLCFAAWTHFRQRRGIK
jgi:hypothetical protein